MDSSPLQHRARQVSSVKHNNGALTKRIGRLFLFLHTGGLFPDLWVTVQMSNLSGDSERCDALFLSAAEPHYTACRLREIATLKSAYFLNKLERVKPPLPPCSHCWRWLLTCRRRITPPLLTQNSQPWCQTQEWDILFVYQAEMCRFISALTLCVLPHVMNGCSINTWVSCDCMQYSCSTNTRSSNLPCSETLSAL